MDVFIPIAEEAAYYKNVDRVISLLALLLTIATCCVMIPLMHNIRAITEREQI